MQFLLKTAALAAGIALASAPAMAEVGGTWHVTGDVDGKPFVIDCKFEPAGSQFGGACVDVASADGKTKGGKVHTLSKGSFNANQVQWTYPVKVMMMSIDIDFAGTMNQNRLAGTVTAKGRKGSFTAIRK